MSITLYGIKNCDTVKKARAWLEAHGHPYEFHDFKALGVDETLLHRWIGAAGLEKVLNRAGTTFRKLPESEKSALDENKAIALMMSYPTLIKRPVLERGSDVLIGFKPETYGSLLD